METSPGEGVGKEKIPHNKKPSHRRHQWGNFGISEGSITKKKKRKKERKKKITTEFMLNGNY